MVDVLFADPASAAHVVAEAVRKAGPLDVLVNNAGVMQEAKVEDMPLADWERTLAVNLTVPFLIKGRAAAPARRLGLDRQCRLSGVGPRPAPD